MALQDFLRASLNTQSLLDSLNPQPLPPGELYDLDHAASLSPDSVFDEVAETGIIIVSGSPVAEVEFEAGVEVIDGGRYGRESFWAEGAIAQLADHVEDFRLSDYNIG